MRWTWGIGRGRRAALGALALCLVIAVAGWAAPPGRGRPDDVAAASSFVSVYPLSDPVEIDHYALSDGRSLGRLTRIPRAGFTGAGSAVSTPHLLADGDYMLTLARGDVCGSSAGACHAAPDSCESRVQTLDPDTGTARSLFTVSGAWRLFDAVPSPNGRLVALVEEGCRPGTGSRLVVRNLAGGRSHLAVARLSDCAIQTDVSWNLGSSTLAFGYGRHPDLDDPPAGCGLATAPADRLSGPGSWGLIGLRASCGFDSSAFDSTGIVAVTACADGDGGLNTTLLQYGDRGQRLDHRTLDSFDPPQYGIAAQVQTDPAAGGVLVSEDVADDPDVSDVWTWNGASLRQVGDYFGDAILAEP